MSTAESKRLRRQRNRGVLLYRQRDIDRFWTKVKKGEPNECWLWQALKNGRGYGTFGFTYRHPVGAHRFSYFIHYGDIPQGLEVRHKCDVKACVNPAHLELGTHKDNMGDASKRNRMNPWNRGKTHCVRGHEFNKENTILRSNGKHRKCRRCVKLKVKFGKVVNFPVPITHIQPAEATHPLTGERL